MPRILKKFGGDETAGGAVRLTAAQNVERPVAELDELIDGLRLRPIVGDFGEREVRVLDAGARPPADADA